jgi:hypothetical protein
MNPLDADVYVVLAIFAAAAAAWLGDWLGSKLSK